MKTVLRNAAINASITALYVVAVVAVLDYAPAAVGQTRTVLFPIAMLLLFVFSAAFTGATVLGRPVLWYLEGEKSGAIALFIATLAMLFVLTLVALLAGFVASTR